MHNLSFFVSFSLSTVFIDKMLPLNFRKNFLAFTFYETA